MVSGGESGRSLGPNAQRLSLIFDMMERFCRESQPCSPASPVIPFEEQSDAEQEFYAWRYEQRRRLDPSKSDATKDGHQRKARNVQHLNDSDETKRRRR